MVQAQPMVNLLIPKDIGSKIYKAWDQHRTNNECFSFCQTLERELTKLPDDDETRTVVRSFIMNLEDNLSYSAKDVSKSILGLSDKDFSEKYSDPDYECDKHLSDVIRKIDGHIY